VSRNVGLSAGTVALVALVVRIVSPTAGEAGPADTAGSAEKTQARETARTPQPYQGPWIATRHFFAPYEPPPTSVQASGARSVDLGNPEDILRCSRDRQCRTEVRRFFGLGEADRAECLLATVPDPLHTRLALYTDHSIEAIRRGAGAAKWVFATQWLPWNDTADPTQTDPAKKANEKQPGLLAFRPAVEEGSEQTGFKPVWATGGLLVFLVGETPTAGINPDQFQIARAYSQALCTPGSNPETVKIVGPTFSGSFYSLADLILQDKASQPGRTYRVQSGTAQGSGVAEAFQARAGVSFHSATDNIRDQDRHFRHLLDEFRIPPQRAAVLAEGESTFGRAASHAGSAEDIHVLRFPRDISHLRDAYRQVVQASKSSQSPSPTLDFSLKDSSVGEDTVPTYSQKQTPLSQNGVINEITRAIKHDNIRIVEVSATNVLDLLFLAGVLRRQCPDTRLLILNADLLFVQAEQSQPLAGTLFLTSYPLFAESKIWEGRNEIAIFPDTLSEGIFNATVLSLADPADLEKALADYAWESVDYPPAWLLTLDRRGFAPVRFWARHPTQERQDWFKAVPGMSGHTDLRRVSASGSFILLSIAFALFSAAAGIWILRAGFAPPESEDSWRGFYLFLSLLILIAIQIALAIVRPRPWPLVLLVGCGVPAWIAGKIGFRHWRPRQPRWLATWLGIAAVLSAVLLWRFCCAGDETRQQLFAFRAAEMRFGSSPLWPILAAAITLLLWCFFQVRRLHFAFCEQPVAIAAGMENLLNGRLKAFHDDFVESARSVLGFTGDQRIWFGAGLALLVPLGWLFRVDLRLGAILGSIDGTPYDVLCISLQVLVVGLLLLTCRQIRVLWRSLHGFAANLGMLPLARAFTSVSPAGDNRPIWARRFDLQALDIHASSLRILDDLGLQSAQLPNDGPCAAAVAQWQTEYRGRIDGALTVGSRLADVHRGLWTFDNQAASGLWKQILMPRWESDALAGKLAGEPLSKPREPAPDDPKSVPALAENFLALHYSLFVLYGVRQILNLLWFPSIGFMLLMLSLNSYSFQAPHLIGRFLIVMFAAIAFILGSCIVEMERSPILSAIAGTKPGELNSAFYLKLVRYGALPIIGLLASQFPSISGFLLSWIEPALEALN